MTSHRGEHLDRRSRQPSRHKLRAHLFGSSPDLTQYDSSEGSEEGGRSGIADVARGVRDRLSRTASTMSHLPSTRRSSVHSNNPSASSRLSLTPEPKMPDPEETSRIVEEIKEKASNDRLAAYNHVSTPVDDDAPEFIMTPIRRRSLFTPGLATRTPTDILRKPPPPERLQSQADRDYYFDPSLPQSSPLSRLAALDLADEVPRASTPVNLDYTYLGGIRIGTLRVTNGTDSPLPHASTPSNTSMPSTPRLRKEEDYFAASEGMLSDDEGIQPVYKGSPRQSGGAVQLTEEPIRVPRRTEDIGKTGRPTLTVQTACQGGGSPFKYERHERGVSSDQDINERRCQISPSKNRRSRSCYEASVVSADCASSIAHEYMLELPNSPFSYPNPTSTRSPTLEATMQASEFKDETFDDEDILAWPLGGAGVTKWKSFIEDAEARHAIDESREEAFKILNGESEIQPKVSSPAFDTDEHGNVVSELSAKPLSKADSGYSSNGSVKSGRKRTSTNPGEQDPRPISLSAQREFQCLPESREMLQPTVTRSDDRSQSNNVTPKSILVRTSITGVPKSLSTESASAPTAQALPEPTTKTMGSSSNYPTVSPIKSRKTLKKARPLLTPMPVSSITVQSYREPNHSQIPAVPSDLAARHAERLREFPLLEHTFPSSHHTHLGSTSPNSEPDFVPITFPSPAHGFEDAETPPSSPDDKLLCMSGFSWRSRSRSQKHKKSTFRSKSLSRQQSLPGQCDFRTTMADYDGFTKSVGGNPYEIARSKSFTGSEGTGEGFLSYRPQLNTPLPRSRSNFGMDGEAASEFARVRSRQKSRSISRPWGTYHESFDDRGGIRGKLARPQSCSAYTPPVPALPTPEQVEQTERRLLRWSADGSHVLTPPYQIKRLSELSKAENPRTPNSKVDQSSAQFLQNLEHPRPLSSYPPARTPVDGSVAPPPPTRKAPELPVSIQGSAVPPPPTRKAPPPPAPADWLSPNSEVTRSQVPLRPLSTGSQHSTISKQASRSFHLPMTPPESLPGSKNASTTSLKFLAAQGGHVVAATASFERLSGRYDGGLSFGYEPGFGLGGSAGTRDGKTGASRKSVDVSRGFGIDLSDIPIFVAQAE